MSSSPGNILLLQLGDIGDVVLSFPCVRALKETYPEANVVVAVREKAAELIEMCPWADGVISVGKSSGNLCQQLNHQVKFITKLHRYRFDMAIDMRTGTRGAVLAYLSGAPRRIAFYAEDGKLWRNRVFTDLKKPAPTPNMHVIDFHLELLASFGIVPENKEPEIVIPEDIQQVAAELLLKEKIPAKLSIVAIQPFSLWSYKEWAPEKFAELISWIRKEYDLPVVITGGPDEREKAANLMNRCGEGVYNLAGKTPIGTYAALLQACSLLISVDSAGPHIAAAVGTPTVTIYGPAAPKAWAPRGGRHRVVQKDLPCVPCLQTGCNGSMVSRCIEELSVDEVIESVNSLLSE